MKHLIVDEVFLRMRTPRLFLLFPIIALGVPLAQPPAQNNATQKQQKIAKPNAGKSAKESKTVKKSDKDEAKLSAKKAEDAKNQVDAQGYRTTARKP